jgi:adenylate cyclase
MIFRPRTFGAKLLLLVVAVVAAAQIATWLIVSRYNARAAEKLIDDELQQAAQTFTRIVNYRNSLLVAGASTAARASEIKRQFVRGRDDPLTFASALDSIRLSSRSDIVAALTLEADLIAATMPAMAAGDILKQLVGRAEADPSPNPSAAGFGILDGQLYSLVLAPVRAPDIIAWLLIGFRIDRDFTAELKAMTGIDLTFFDVQGRPLASTLPPATIGGIAASLHALGDDHASHRLELSGETALVALRRLSVGSGKNAILALQYSLDEKLAPARATEKTLLIVATASLVVAIFLSRAFARRLVQPIVELVGHTRRIAAGDYSIRNTAYRTDELGRLSEAFDQMSRGLSERDRIRDLLDKNVSPEVAAQLLRDGAALGGEERQVTILFVDLRGFTTMSERYAPRELLTLLNRYLDRMSRAIEENGGIVDKYIGDAIMALFGAPVDQPDAPGRAIAAALAMQRALADFNRELVAEGRPPLAIGVGINTARVVAGNIGSARRLNYSVIGDGVNVAARLQSLTRDPAYATNIIVSAQTVRASTPPFAVRDLGSVAVKGRAEPVAIYAIDG